jgi:hypothetical protein
VTRPILIAEFVERDVDNLAARQLERLKQIERGQQ